MFTFQNRDGILIADNFIRVEFPRCTIIAHDFVARIIKAVREITGLGLKDAKGLVDNVPSVIKEGVSEDEANDIKEKLEAVGAVVTLK